MAITKDSRYLDGLETENKELKVELATLDAEIEHLKSANDEQLELNNKLKSKLFNSEEDVKHFEKLNSKLRAQLADLGNQFQDASSSSRETRELKRQISSLRIESEELQRKFELQQEKIRAKDEEFNEATDRHSREKAKLLKAISAKDNDISDLEDQLRRATLQAGHSGLEEEVQSLRDKLIQQRRNYEAKQQEAEDQNAANESQYAQALTKEKAENERVVATYSDLIKKP
ncbi:unnamed protein product [Ambrosiozyma monospora]|uniref:Unnamed protein product n=1 Tax=Ambrosiozyma monospora TaxID=43982 RepID=A0ACB5U8I7_AMBMO|nr:unnamed protein product [Ambrosiozyma monospora]